MGKLRGSLFGTNFNVFWLIWCEGWWISLGISVTKIQTPTNFLGLTLQLQFHKGQCGIESRIVSITQKNEGNENDEGNESDAGYLRRKGWCSRAKWVIDVWVIRERKEDIAQEMCKRNSWTNSYEFFKRGLNKRCESGSVMKKTSEKSAKRESDVVELVRRVRWVWELKPF